MGLVRKIKAGLVKISVNEFVGEDGNLFFDIDDGILRLSDGVTPGGIPLSNGGEGGASTFRQLLDTPNTFAGSGGRFVKVNPQASALEFVDVSIFDGNYNNLTNKPTLFNPSLVTTSLVPQTNAAIDLGTNTNKWRDLYLSGTTISLGDAVIRSVEGTVELPVNAKINGRKIATDVKELDDVDNLLSGGGVTSYNDLTDRPTLFSGSYTDLTNKPTLFTGSYNDLTNKPTLFSGSYTDLTNKPTIPTDVSNLTDNTNLLGGNYVLPTASATVKGGVKIGSGLSMSETGVVSVTSVPGESTSPIRTFNIIGEFSAPLLGKAIFVPAQSDTIRSVILTNSSIVPNDLMVGLYRNNELLNFFTIPSGYFTYTYSNLNFVLNTNDYVTVNVVAGSGANFSLSLYNFNI